MAKKLEPAEEYVLQLGNNFANIWKRENIIPGGQNGETKTSIVAAAAMVAAVQRFDRSSGRQMRAAIWISIVALLISIISLIIGIF